MLREGADQYLDECVTKDEVNNHRPTINVDDDAMLRRIKVISFTNIYTTPEDTARLYGEHSPITDAKILTSASASSSSKLVNLKKSLRLTPSSKASTAGSASVLDTANSYGLHDTMRFGMRQIASEVSMKHPLENRLVEWESTQEELKMNSARNLYGMHAPIKMAMERSLVIKARGPSMIPQRSNLGLDILMGKDETIDFEDFLNVPEMSTEMVDPHTVMEHQIGLRV
ncbi:hypothetical protein BGZ49_000394 [Haplosporangium sp. Z 27]|nr:hypothetical protein BGZ49_000394 [Haplosporangium sp. Z 27]